MWQNDIMDKINIILSIINLLFILLQNSLYDITTQIKMAAYVNINVLSPDAQIVGEKAIIILEPKPKAKINNNKK